jgi:radical SAM superfamily enzyme YgiQ (UPF0313 family)
LNPPRFNELLGKNPSIIEQHRGYNPPLGLLSLATSIGKWTGGEHQVEILDAQPMVLSYAQLRAFFKENRFDVVGITAMTFTLLDVVASVRIIKETNPDCVVVLGGAHVHLFPEETINLKGVDYLIQGEGEYSILQFIKALEDRQTLSDVSGLVYLENSCYHNNGITSCIEDLNELGFPDRRYLPTDQYYSVIASNNLITTMFTSRGCPFKCAFCDRPTSPVYSKFRWRSAQSVADELEDCYELGIREILIYDDTFTVRKDRVHAICEEILSRGLNIRWDVRAHVNTVDKDLLKAMKRAGCVRVHYGVECGNDRMLKVINKKTNVKTIKRVFHETRELGIETLAYFMIGNPTEMLRDIDDTMALALDLKPDFAHFTVFCPYPGTRFYRLGLETGIIKRDIWREFARDPQPDFELPVWEANFTKEALYNLIVKCYKKFYLRPSYVMKRLARVRSFGELKRKALAGHSVIWMNPQKVDRRNY